MAYRRTALLAALFLGAALCSGDSVVKNPITKVVELITELKDKVIADGKFEENTYKKMACWCETTTELKAEEIKEGKEELAELSDKMSANKGAIAGAAADIADLMNDITAMTSYQYKETTKRERQNADFMQNKAELTNAISSLDKAVQMLSGVDALSLLQGQSKAGAEAKARAALAAALPLVQKAAATLPAELPAPVKQLAALEKAATTFSTQYTPFQPTVTSILKDLLESFRATAETEQSNEAELQTSYDKMMQSKAESLKLKREMMKQKEDLKAAEERDLTANGLTWQSVADSVTAANDLFAAAKEACTQKSTAYKARVAARAEELEGINKALEILTSDDARALIGKAAKDGPGVLDFLQVDSSAPKGRIGNAYKALKRAAAQSKSIRLARLASSVQRKAMKGDTDAEKGHDDWKVTVIESINKMLGDLAEEQKVDTLAYDNCKTEEQKLKLILEDTAHQIKRHEISLAEMNAKVESLDQSIEDASKEIAEIVKNLDEATTQRNAENKEYTSEKEDDEGAIKILESAIEALGAYSKKQEEKKAAALLQTKASLRGVHHVVKASRAKTNDAGPVFEVSNEDMLKQMDAHDFSKEDSRTGATGGIVALMTNIKEDLESDIKKSDKLEEQAQAEYDVFKTESEDQKDALESDIDDYKSDKAETNTNIDDTEGEKKTEEDTHFQATQDMNALLGKGTDEIPFPCQFMMDEYHNRRHRRDAEVEGLKEAIAFLEGKAPR